jgi:glycosyltransferase involved in cell wall biosynthesis
LKVYRPLQKVVIFSIPNIHVLNKDDLDMLKKEGYNGRIYYIPNFLYYKKNQIHIKGNKKKFIVLFGGRLAVYHKGIDLLTEIIERVLEINKDIEFHIFGSGEDGQKLIEELNKKYPNNVKYLGFIPNKQLEKEYQEASLYIITSRIESFPLVTLEAQAHGLPVIAFDIKGPRNIIKNDFQGKLIKPFEIGDFVKAILYYYGLWKEGKLSKDYKKRVVDRIFSRYSDKEIVHKLEKMLTN